MSMAEKDLSSFYNTTARNWVRSSVVSTTNGATMMTMLDEEYERITQSPINNFGVLAYGTQLHEVYKVAADAMMSAVHRSVFHHHVNNSSPGGFHVATDEEELQIANESSLCESDDDQDSLSSIDEPVKKVVPPTSGEVKARKREEAKKRRGEDQSLLLNDRKVRDEKNHLMTTVGPFSVPRLTIRSLKSAQAVPSRKTLTQRTIVEARDEGDESDDEELVFPPSSSDQDAVARLNAFLQPLPVPSLKKMAESAKVKLRANCSHKEAVDEIVKSAIKLGCEKACVLMDKNKMLDKVATQAKTTRTSILTQLASSIPSFLESLPADMLRLLAPALGIPNEAATVSEMLERIIAMGFCAVLTHLRPRPLKNIIKELSLAAADSWSTEKHCEHIVYHAFPGEYHRIRAAKSLKRVPGVDFSLVPGKACCIGDMGFLIFNVHNVSVMRNDSDRHYTPEFEFGGLRWSLLCMANKDSLALYLCQQGTVHCKFIITVVNHNPDDSVFNEGTQKFSSASAENDWGFNNVVKFDYLMDPKNGFWHSETDHISIEVGIVLVESNIKPSTSAAQALSSNRHAKAAQAERIVASEAEKLLEAERLDALKKKVKQDLARTQKEEERLRKEHGQRQGKGWQQLLEQQAAEVHRMNREHVERERKEQLERSREQERLRQQQEQTQEMQRRHGDLTEEGAELAGRKKALAAELKELRKQIEEQQHSVAAADAEVSQVQRQNADAVKKLQKRESAVKALRKEVAAIAEPPAPPVQLATQPADDNDMMFSVQQSLAAIVDGW
jgi:hypothetical protein